jgi:hypothetical protein
MDELKLYYYYMKMMHDEVLSYLVHLVHIYSLLVKEVFLIP